MDLGCLLFDCLSYWFSCMVCFVNLWFLKGLRGWVFRVYELRCWPGHLEKSA